MVLLRLLIGRAVLSCAALLVVTAPVRADDLMALYVKALDGNPEYQSALAAYQQALEAKPAALAKLLPQIGASGGYDYAQQTISGRFFVGAAGPGSPGVDTNRDDSFNSLNYVVGLNQALYHRDLLIGLDESELMVSRAGLLIYSAQNALRLGLSQAYFAALAADDQLRFVSAERAAVERILEQTRTKAGSGLVADAELKTAQAQFDLAEAELIAAKNAVSVSRTQLELLTGGSTPGVLKPLAEDYVAAPPVPDQIGEWIERAKNGNLLVQAQLVGTQIAKKELDKANAQRWPTLDASAARTYTYADGGLSRGIGSDNNHGSDNRIGVRLRIPIYSGGAVSAGIRAAQAGVTRAEADENAKRGEALREVQIAFLNSSAGIAKIRALKQAVASSIAAEDAARVGNEVGTKTNSELLLAVRSRYRAERDQAVARYDFIINTLRLRAAAGSLSHADLLAINSALR